MKYLFSLFFLFFSLSINSQIFQTGTITVTFNDPSRTGGFGSGGGPGRQIQTEIYYPASVSGSNVAVATGSFPVIVIGHGFVMDWSSYDNIYSALSKRGYIVALPRTEGGFSPNHSDFGKDLALVGDKILQLNSTNTLVPNFIGKVIQKLAISGHSMGGGSSFLSASNNVNLTCLFNFAAAQTTPRSSQAAKTVTVPTLIISGKNDCVTPLITNQLQMWDSTASNKKFLVNIKNLTHCDFGNGSNFNCTFGQSTSGCSNTIPNATALKLYMNFVNPFLDANLKGDCVAANQFMDSLNLSQVIFSKNILGSLACNLSSSGNLNKLNQEIKVYPNPARARLSIESELEIHLKLFSIEGKQLDFEFIKSNSGYEIDLSKLERGIYFLSLSNETINITKKIILD